MNVNEGNKYTDQDLIELIEGRIGWDLAKDMMSSVKDPDRFQRIRDIEQGRVPWQEQILVPLSEGLYVVDKGSDGIVKCRCGHEFGDFRVNWKLFAEVYVRDTADSLEELYPGDRKPDPRWCEVREYYCPVCHRLLEVEALPPGYPPVFNFLPDIEGFYTKWLGKSPFNLRGSTDITYELTRAWAQEASD